MDGRVNCPTGSHVSRDAEQVLELDVLRTQREGMVMSTRAKVRREDQEALPAGGAQCEAGSETVVRQLAHVLEQLDCSVVETSHCPGTDVYSLQVICSAHRTGQKLRLVIRS